MAIIVPTIDLPRNCNSCPFLRHEYEWEKFVCVADRWTDRDVFYPDTRRLDDCPLKEYKEEEDDGK